MIETFSTLTLTLAKIIAIYLIAVGLMGLRSPSRWKRVIEDMQGSPGLIYVTALMVFFLSITLITLHSLWTDPLAIVVSLIGWAGLVESLLLLAVPDALMRLGVSLVTPSRSKLWAAIALVLGVLLLLAAVFGRATAGA
jgi:hypothetical protein